MKEFTYKQCFTDINKNPFETKVYDKQSNSSSFAPDRHFIGPHMMHYKYEGRLNLRRYYGDWNELGQDISIYQVDKEQTYRFKGVGIDEMLTFSYTGK